MAQDSIGGFFDLFNCCKLGGPDGIPEMQAIGERNKCGVGINFQPDATGALAVHSVVPGEIPHTAMSKESARSRNEPLNLRQVDGVNVYRCSLKQVSGILLGTEGSVVRLTFQRPTPAGSSVRVETLLRRSDIRRLRSQFANSLPDPPPPGGQLSSRSTDGNKQVSFGGFPAPAAPGLQGPVPGVGVGQGQYGSLGSGYIPGQNHFGPLDSARSVHTTPRYNLEPDPQLGAQASRFSAGIPPSLPLPTQPASYSSAAPHTSGPAADKERSDLRSRTGKENLAKDGEEAELLSEAEVAADQGRVADAQDLFLRVLRVNPSHVGAMCGLATLLHSSRSDLLQAEALYQHALRLDPKHVRSLCSYGLLLRDKYGDDSGGEVFFKRALEADPTDTDTLCNYALLLTNVQKDHRRAAGMFEEALKHDPAHVRTLCGYGMLVQNVNKDYVGAKALFSRALQKDPKHIPSTINLAVLYRDHLNERKAAESLIQHALKIDPGNPWLQSNAAAFTAPA